MFQGKYWAGLRAGCETIFHSRQLARYAPLMNTASANLATRLRKVPFPIIGGASSPAPLDGKQQLEATAGNLICQYPAALALLPVTTWVQACLSCLPAFLGPE